MHDLGVITRLLLGAADKVVNSRGSYAKPRRMNRPAKFAGLQRTRGSPQLPGETREASRRLH